MSELMLALALIGSAVAGLYDLKTTEVPDDIPYLMVAFGIFYWFVFALTFGDFYPLFLSLSFGTLLLALGLALYRFGQWGEADAWLLAAVAYAIPLYNNKMFMPAFAVNFFIVGIAYNVIYAIALGLLHPVWKDFLQDIRRNARLLLIPLAFLFLAVVLQAYVNADALFYASLLFFFLLFFWRYAKVIETKVFRKRIASRELKEGDVVGPVWRGLTYEEIKDIRKKQKYVVVKEGVRFVPVFPITLVVTLVYGNLIFVFI